MKRYRIVPKGEIVKLGDEFCWYPDTGRKWNLIKKGGSACGKPSKGGINQATIRREIVSIQDRIMRAF